MARRPPIDFAAIAHAALQDADRLVSGWLPQGKREGREWSALNPNRADSGLGSFKINLDTGAWSDFATGDKGGDLVSLWAYLHHGGDQVEAARELADDLRISAAPTATVTKLEPKRRSPWSAVTPVPDGAPPPPKAHTVRGLPTATWAYRGQQGELLGAVYRFTTSDGSKEILPAVWGRHDVSGKEEWRWMQWPVPRPLYGLWAMPKRADLPVLIVEGEKCRDRAHELLGDDFLVLSWPGGGNAVDRADWSVIRGRAVVIWPDCDAQRHKVTQDMLPEAQQPGTKAAEAIARKLLELECTVEIVTIPAPGEKADGWDVFDAAEDGLGRPELIAFIANRRPPASAEASPEKVVSIGKGKGDGTDDSSAPADEVGSLLFRKGEVVGCLANVVRIFTRHKAWRGVIAFDEFTGRAVKLKPFPGRRNDAPGSWTTLDTSHAIIWLTNRYGMTTGNDVVDQAVETVARAQPFHRVREYLQGLEWDGVLRTHAWLEMFLGVPKTEYSKRVARWFLLAMVYRVFEPGCKFDNCLVLEGAQGLRKSSVFRVLAGDWFHDTDLDIGDKDSVLAIQGSWIHEFQEMGSLIRQEASRQKSFLTRQEDVVRPVYERRLVRWPRQIVFGGTVNDWQWQKDPTGGRRFWPVEVSKEIDLEGLQAVRDQLFAEAYVGYQKRLRYWPTREEQDEYFSPEQLKRAAEDSFTDLVHDWLELRVVPEFTMANVLQDCLKLDAARMTRDVTTRVGVILKNLGCRRVERRNGVTRFVYQLPDWTSASMESAKRRAAEDGDEPLPF